MLFAQDSTWHDVDIFSIVSIKQFLDNDVSPALVEQARAAIALHETMEAIRTGAAKSKLVIPKSSLTEQSEKARIRFMDDSERPEKYLLGLRDTKVKPKRGEIIRYGSHNLAYGTAVSMGIIKNGYFAATESFPVLGIRTSFRADGGSINCSYVPGSILAFETVGEGMIQITDDIALTSSPNSGPIYFGLIEGLGLVHISGAGTALVDDETILLE